MTAGSLRIGQGVDVHAFAEGRPLILGGVDVPHPRGLAGHSDADVLTHAIMDAALGALGRGDIGRRFPDTDAAFKGADSLALLDDVVAQANADGFSIAQVDATIIAQQPKLAPFIDEMRRRIAERTGGLVNVKATTTEALGFTGREEGIAAQAVCLLVATASE